MEDYNSERFAQVFNALAEEFMCPNKGTVIVHMPKDWQYIGYGSYNVPQLYDTDSTLELEVVCEDTRGCPINFRPLLMWAPELVL